MLLIVIHLLLCCLQVRMSLLSLLGEIDLAVGVDRRYILVLGCSISDQGAIRVLVLKERTITRRDWLALNGRSRCIGVQWNCHVVAVL